MVAKKMSVAVIGAGPAGLVTIKELLDEHHDVVCFEKTDKEGGVFNYRDIPGGVYESTVLTVSNHFMAYSSFPPKESESRYYWDHREYKDYLNAFIRNFNLKKHIKLNTDVVDIKVQESNKVCLSVIQSGKNHDYEFDAVAICTGVNQVPYTPAIEGNDIFQGKVFHSSEYKEPGPFKGKRVLCVGIGESGSDIAHEISGVAESCVLAVRNFSPVLARYLGNKSDRKDCKFTNDVFTSRALYALPKDVLNYRAQKRWCRSIREDDDAVWRGVLEWNGHVSEPHSQFFTKNEAFIHDIVSKQLSVNSSGIKALTKTGVEFNDGCVEDIDAVVLTTGFKEKFFGIPQVTIENSRQLYKHMFHPDLGRSVAYIGRVRPTIGGAPACFEMQARYFSAICSGRVQLPLKYDMQKQILEEGERDERRFHLSPRLKSLIHYPGYMDDLAQLIGCRPKFSKMLTKPKLLYKVWFGSLLSYQYRLQGPHAMPEMADKNITKLGVGYHFFNCVELTFFLIMCKLASVFGVKKWEDYS